MLQFCIENKLNVYLSKLSFISVVWVLIIIVKYVTVFIIVKHVLGIVKNLSIFNFRVCFLLLLFNNFSSTKVNSFLEISIICKYVFFSLLSQNSLALTSASISSNSLANASLWSCGWSTVCTCDSSWGWGWTPCQGCWEGTRVGTYRTIFHQLCL